LKIFKKRQSFLITALTVALVAYGWFWLSLGIYRVSNENTLTSTILNIAVIIIALIYDRIRNYFYVKRKAHERKRTVLSRLIDFWVYSASVKTSLYLFYIGILICTAIIAVDVDFPFLTHMSDYFKSVEYGLLILLVTDIFLNRLLNDKD